MFRSWLVWANGRSRQEGDVHAAPRQQVRMARKTFAWLGASALAACASVTMIAAAPAVAADPAKVLNWHFETPETGFDPVLTSDFYSSTVMEAIFERLLTYDYLARPLKLVPMVTEALPEVSPDGKTYTFKIKKGIYFSDDPAFKGKKRELVARDFVYSFMRHVDPKNRSPWAFFFEGKIVGLNELIDKAKKTGQFDYDANIAGLETPDSHTLIIRLTDPDLNYPYIMAHAPTGAVAREVIEHYGQEIQAHPVGTGPYVLKEWVRRSKIVLEANPAYRGFIWDAQPSDDPADKEIIARMKGKKMPQIGKVVIHSIEEPQGIWLAFDQNQLDIIKVPATMVAKAQDSQQRRGGEAAKASFTMRPQIEPEITYTFFNMADPLVGGFSKEKIALRRAIAMAYDTAAEIQVVRRGQAIKTQMVIPVNMRGYDPKYRSSIPYDPDLANRLLDKYGYKRGADGWRTQPDGSPLLLKYHTEPISTARELNELWRKALQEIGLNVEFVVAPFSDNYKASKACKLMMWGSAWIADYPDGENFMQLLYGKNIGLTNHACYKSAAFDAMYEQLVKMPDSADRNALFAKMNRQFEADTPWVLNVSRRRWWTHWNHVQGFKKHPLLHADWIYLDIEAKR